MAWIYLQLSKEPLSEDYQQAGPEVPAKDDFQPLRCILGGTSFTSLVLRAAVPLEADRSFGIPLALCHLPPVNLQQWVSLDSSARVCIFQYSLCKQ